MGVSPTLMQTAITFRHATLADAAALVPVVNRAYRGGLATVPWKNENHLVSGPRIDVPEVEQRIGGDNSRIVVAEIVKDNKPLLIGCVHVERHGAEAHIGLLSVDPDCQNMGLGKQLITQGELCAREFFKCEKALMYVLSGRPELLDWYVRVGYTPTGETEPFPADEGGWKTRDEDAHFVVISKGLGK